MQEVKIIPIFDQSAPDVWTDFARIQSSAMLTNYNYPMTDRDIQDIIINGRKDSKIGTNFAFGAFANDKMVGFIRGTSYNRTATICSLYVVKEFQKQKVGHQLLQQAESSIGVFANRIELVSLSKAESFYKAHGYASILGRNSYSKDRIKTPHCGCVPVFKCDRKLEAQIQQLQPSFMACMVNQQHLPVFAYFNANGRVVGCAFNGHATVEQNNCISDIVMRSLQRNIAKVR